MLRSYDPQIGRFLQNDPYDQFASGYVGMGNDPGNNVDPTGGIVPSSSGFSSFARFAGSVQSLASRAAPALSTVASVSQAGGNAAGLVSAFGSIASISAIAMKAAGVANSIARQNQNILQSSFKSNSLTVAQSKRDARHNSDGTNAEDLMGCRPSSSDGELLDFRDLYNKTDEQLFNNMKSLFDWLTKGKMKRVGAAMIDWFRYGDGSDFTNSMLNSEVENDNDFATFAQKTANAIKKRFREINGRLDKFGDPLDITPPNFSDLRDKVGGLGITIHDVWSAQVEITDYKYNPKTGNFTGQLVFILYDHFGLDRQDVWKTEDIWLLPPNGGTGFRSWYMLQRLRCYKPFVTKIEITYDIFGNIFQ